MALAPNRGLSLPFTVLFLRHWFLRSTQCVCLWPAHPGHHTSPNIKASPFVSLPLYHHIPYRHLCRLRLSLPLRFQTNASLNCHLSSLARKTVIFLKIYLGWSRFFFFRYFFKDLSAFQIMRASAITESSSFSDTARAQTCESVKMSLWCFVNHAPVSWLSLDGGMRIS